MLLACNRYLHMYLCQDLEQPISENDKSKEEMGGKTPFNCVIIADIAQFVHKRALCNFPVCHKQNNQLLQAVRQSVNKQLHITNVGHVFLYFKKQEEKISDKVSDYLVLKILY